MKDAIIQEINRLLSTMSEKELQHVRAIVRQEFKLHEMEEETSELQLEEEKGPPNKVRRARGKRKSEHTKALHPET